ncbi:hypothetical protein Q8791_28965 [Nocardiopsis sp. CT-R113]|uniref:Integral membrane protein n=1 Tax=Nocardiopsis codii TaxID=3065942 RepID=A0ABU7KGC6_9ACTN|nr:hypothetical protein [Nocardiopsis sp. CT-R113]MEE2041263.1 hypothetical protein [Nocardiopsis sp. CT-R113]
MTDPTTTPRRDPAGATLGAVLTAVFAGLGVWLWTLDAWWWTAAAVVCALLTAFGAYGFAESLRRVPRDRRGIAQHEK